MKFFPVLMLMLLCLQPMCKLSAQMVEDGTEDHPFLIQNLDEFKAFRDAINNCTDSVFFFANGTYVLDTAGMGYTDVQIIRRGGKGSYFKLTTNITLNRGDVAGCNGAGDASWEQWVPIGLATGTPKQSFMGYFDGGGHYVSGLYINKDDENALGLFGCITDGARLYNVALVNSFIRTVRGHYVGGIVGWNIGSEVHHCFNASTIIGHHGIGGIVGQNSRETYSSGALTKVSECYNTGTVKSEGTLTLTSSSSSDAGRQDAGGIVGINEHPCEVRNCYNAGVVRVESSPSDPINFGGIVGDNGGEVVNCFTDESICGSGGNGTSGNENLADSNGLRTNQMTNVRWVQLGSIDNWTYTNGYYPQLRVFTQTDAREASKFSVTPVFTYNRDNVEALEYDVTLGGTSESVVWSSNYPARAVVNGYTLTVVGKGEFILKANAGDTLFRAIYMESATGADEGSISNPFTIDNKEELISFRDDINNGYEFMYKKRTIPAHARGIYFLLTADINLNGEETKDYLSWNRTTAPSLVWTAIGKNEDVPFAGHFMGGGHTISGLYGTSLFGVVDTNASVTNLGVGVGNSLGDGGYVTDGLVIWLDGEQNTRHGHDTTATVWENLAGPNYDFTAYDYGTMKWTKNGFYGTGNAGRWHCGSTQWREIYNMQKVKSFTVEAVSYINRSNTIPSYRTLVGTFRSSSYSSTGFSMYNNNGSSTLNYMPFYLNIDNQMATLTARSYGSGYVNKQSSSHNYDPWGSNGTRSYYYNYGSWSFRDYIQYSTEPIILGNGYNNERSWNDTIYGLRVYSRSLTEAEVKQNYQADSNHFKLGYPLRGASLVSRNHGVVSDCFSVMDDAPMVYENSGVVSHCYIMGNFSQKGNAALVGVNLSGGTVEYGYYAGTSDHVLKMVASNSGTVNHLYYDKQTAPLMKDALATARTTAEMTSGSIGLPTEHWQETAGRYPRLQGSAVSVTAQVLANPVTLAAGEDVRAVNNTITFGNNVDAMSWNVISGDGLQIAGSSVSVAGAGKTTLQPTVYGWPYRTVTLTVAPQDYGVFYITDLDQLKIFRNGINQGLDFYYNPSDRSFSLSFDNDHQRVVPANGRNARFVLLDDINMSSESDWEPIGNVKSSFQGEFNGNGKKIHSATWIMKRFYNGLFGKAENALILNLKMEDCVFNSQNNDDWQNYSNYSGFICASFSGTLDSCSIYHCKINSLQTNNRFTGGEVGGLVGAMQGVLSNCYALEDTLNIYYCTYYSDSYNKPYSFYGGLAGSVIGGAMHCYVQNSYLKATTNYSYFSDRVYIGGLFGQVSFDTIAYCYNDHSAMYGTSYYSGFTGGIAGGSANATVFHHCYNTGEITGCFRVAGICPLPVVGNTFNYCFNAGDIVLKEGNSGKSYLYSVSGIGVGNANYCFNTGEIHHNNSYSVDIDNNNGSAYDNYNRLAGLVFGVANHCYNAGRVVGLNVKNIGMISGTAAGADSYNVGKYVNHFTSTEYKVGYNDAQMSTHAPSLYDKNSTSMVSANFKDSLNNSNSDWVYIPNKYPILRGLEQYDAAVVSVSPIYLREGERADSVQHNFTVDTTRGVIWSVLDGNAVEIQGDSVLVTGLGSVVLGASKNGALYKKVYLVVGFSEDRPLIVRNYEELVHFRDGINSTKDFYYNPTPDQEGFSLLDTGNYSVRVPALGEGAWFLQTQNIEMPISASFSWVPIGNHTSAVFMGVYDGGHKEIRNMQILNNSNIWYSGLFARMGQGSGIKNLGIVNSNIKSLNTSSYCATGALVAMIDGTNVRFVDSCYVKRATVTASFRSGALCGRSNAPVTHCYADSCTLSFSYNYGAGLIGYATQSVTNCKVTNTKLTIGSYSGGLVGYSTRPITNCQVVNTSISCSSTSGGLVGYATQIAHLLRDTVKNVQITNNSATIGGIVGYVAGAITIDSCLVHGGFVKSTSSYNNIGGIVGYNGSSNMSILHCRNLGMLVEGSSSIGGILGGSGNSCMVQYCSNFSEVMGKQNTGGIVGYGYSATIEYCYNVGDIKTPETGVSDQYIGGIAGQSGSVRYCFNTGRVRGSSSGTQYVGGICGYNGGNYSQYCYNVGEISTGQNVGGLVGYNCAQYGYNAGRVSGGTTINAALATNTNGSYTKNVYYDYQMCPTTVVEAPGKKRNTLQMVGTQLNGGKIGADSYWVFQEGLYPQLKYFAESPDSLDRLVSRVSVTPVFLYDNHDTVETVNNVTHTVTFGAGSADTVQWTRRSGSGLLINHNIGTPTDTIGVVVADAYLHDTMPYKTVRFLMNITEDNALIIKDYPNLKVFRDGVNSGRPFYYHLANQDFDTTSHVGDDDYMEIPVGGEDVYFRLAENTFNLSDTAWVPIGTLSSPFRGSFNGSHQTIENMNVNFTPAVNYDSLLSRTPTRTVLMNTTSTTITDTLHDSDVVAFYDDGGPNQNYSNTNGNYRYHRFRAEPGRKIIFHLKYFDNYNSYNSQIYMYDDYSGYSYSYNINDAIYCFDRGGYVMVRWYSNNRAPGWEAVIMQVPTDFLSNSTLNNDYSGFFGFATGGYIKNLNFTQAKVSGRSYVGTLAGLTAGKVDSIFCMQSIITATTSNVGGVIGRAENSVSHCVSENTMVDRIYLRNNPNNWGGICGYFYLGTLSDCYTKKGRVSNYYKWKNMNINNSYSNYNYNSYYSKYTGGLVGCMSNVADQIIHCGNTATTQGGWYTGGVVGYSERSVYFSYNTGEINSYLYYTGCCTSDYTGGVAGYANGVYNCINIGDVNSEKYFGYKEYVGGVAGASYCGYCINTGSIKSIETYNSYSLYTGGINGSGNAEYCFNAGEVYGNRSYTVGVSANNNTNYSINAGRVHGNGTVYSVRGGNNRYNDKQMCPGVWTTTYANAEKSTDELLGNQLQNLLGNNSASSRNNWIFEEGMYPRLRWTDTLEWARKMAIVACTPVHLANGVELNTVNEVDTVLTLGGEDTVVWKKIRGNGFEKINDYQYRPAATMGVEYLGAAWHESPDTIYKVVRLINSSEDKPVIIKNRAELIKFRDYINSGEEFFYDPVDTVFYATSTDSNHVIIPAFGESIHFRLDAKDADMTGLTWIPIGTSNSRPFKGYFNGNNKEISHLTVNRSSNSGFFGYVVDGSIKNVKLSEATITWNSGNYNYAILCAYANRTIFLHDTVTSSQMSLNGYYVGSICGNADNSSIIGCYVKSTSINSTGTHERIGGICGFANNTIIDSCHAVDMSFSTSANYLGGVCGYTNSTIRNCSFQSSTINHSNGYYNVGGICGYCEYGNIDNCFNTSTIKSASGYQIGGICGYKYSGTITNCYNTAAIQGAKVGGICGIMSGGTIDRCFNTGNITDNNYSSAFNMGGITSSGTVTNSYNAGRIIARKAASAGSIVGVGSVSQCYNIGYLINEGDGTMGMIIGNTASVTQAYNDVQMNPNGMGNPIIRKPTLQMVGNALEPLLGSENWVYAAGMYPRLKGMDTISNAIAFALPVYLYGAQNVDMVRTQFKVAQYSDGNSNWSGPEVAFDLSSVNIVDSVLIRTCGMDTLVVSYNGQQKVLPMNVDRLEVTFIEAHTCKSNEYFLWDVTGKWYTRSGTYTEAYALTDKCDSVVTLKLFIPKVTLDVIPQFEHITCFGENDGILDADLRGGSGSYKVYWVNLDKDSIISYQKRMENMPPGHYAIVLTDSLYEDCKDTGYVTLIEPELLQASIISSGSGCYNISDGYIEMFVTGGTKDYTAFFDNGSGPLSPPKVFNTQIVREDGLSDGYWTVDVVDKNGCHAATMHTSFHEDPRSFVVKACSFEKLYDGVPVTVDTFTLTIDSAAPFVPVLDTINGEYAIYDSVGYFKDYLHVEVSGVSRTNAGIEDNYVTSCMVIRRYDDPTTPNDTVTCHYNIAVYDGIVNIHRRELTITSQTDAQVGYFGEPFSRPSVSIQGDGFAVGDTIVCSHFPVLEDYTDDAHIPVWNTFDTTWTPSGASVNYNVHLIYGSLAVVHDTIVYITAGTATKVYDGTPLICHEYEVKSIPQLPDSIEVTVTFADTSIITDAGKRMNHIQTYRLYDTVHQRNYTTVYRVVLRDGTLEVEKREVNLKSQSADREYNGMPLVLSDLRVTGQGFLPEDIEGPIMVTGSQTKPGSSTNTISYTTTSSYKESNYILNKEEGTLTVYKRPLFVSGDSLETEYTGATYELTGIHVSGLVAGQYTDVLSYTTGAYRSIGRYEGQFTDTIRVMKLDTLEDVTDCYDIHPYKAGFLKINPVQKPIVITSHSSNKRYDGLKLVCEVYDVTYDGHTQSRLSDGSFRLPTGDTIRISSTYAGSKDVGIYANEFSYVFTYNGENVTSNYTADSIHQQYGNLVITPRWLVLKSGSFEGLYTGYPVYKHEVEVGGYDFAEQEGGIMEGATFTNFASRTDVGDTINTFEIVFNEYTSPSNYAIDTVYGHIVITPAMLKLTADDKTREFGDTTPIAFTYHVTGLVGSDDRSVILTEPTMTTTAGPDSVPGSYPIIMDVTTASAKNYVFTGENGTLDITQRGFVIESGCDTVVYDALPHSIVDMFIPYVFELNGQTYIADYSGLSTQTGEHTNVGVYPNQLSGDYSNVRVMRGTEDYTFCFYVGGLQECNLVIVPDTLTVTPLDSFRMYGEPDPVFRSEITGFNGTDTRENCVSGSLSYFTGAEASSEPGGGTLPGGKYWATPNVSTLSSCYGNYVFRGDTAAMDIVINTLPIRLASQADTFVYDGAAHTHHAYTVLYNGTPMDTIAGTGGLKFKLPAGDTLTFIPDPSASLTTVGKTTNSYSYTLQHNGYYTDVTTFEDTIVMIPCPVDVTIVGKRDTTVYDGVEHHVDGFGIRCANSLYSVHDVVMSGSAYASRTDSGITLMNLQLSQFTNGNENFTATFSVEDGWQKIVPVTNLVHVVLKKRGGVTTYDGYEQRVTGYTFVSADHPAYQDSCCRFTGSELDTIAKGRYVGAYYMNLNNSQFANISPNFTSVTFEVQADSLVIYPNPTSITITAGSAQKGYDGTPLVCNDYTYTDSVLAPGDTLLVVVEGGISELGDSLNRVVDYKVYRDESRNNSMIRPGLRLLYAPPPGYTKDVTACYTFSTPSPGLLKIVPNANAKVTITGHRAEYEYDGLTYTVHGFDVSVADTLGVYSAADFHFTGDSTISQSARGTYHMNLQASQFVNDNPKYGPVTFIISDGRLIIYDTLVVADIITDSVSCKDYHDGEVEITIAGGKRETSPYYSYEIEGINTHATYTGTTDDDIHLGGLAPDTYSVLVRDALMYTVTDTFVIEERSALTVTASVQPALCPNQGTYMLKMTPVGGNGGNHYTWYNVNADGATVVDVDDTSTVVNQVPGNDCAHVYQVGAMVTDRKGCIAKDTVEFIVQDLTSPEFTAPADITLCRNSLYEIDASTVVAGQPDPATFTDNCSSASQLTVEFHDTDTTGTDNDRRVIHRVWRVTDMCGKFTEHPQNITICPAINETNSVFTIPANIDTLIPFGQCNIELPDLGTPSFTTSTVWNVSDITITNDAPASHVYDAGVVIVTWTATDSCGFTITRQQTITVALPPCPDAQDCEGNIYHGVRIGCDCWTQRNLESLKYSDCTDIPGAYAYYSLEYPDVDSNVVHFGRLYDWSSVVRGGTLNAYGHVQGVCPSGWYLPTWDKFAELAAYGADALKSPLFWLYGGGSNTTGFSSLPGGYYDGNALRYLNIMGEAYYWTVEKDGNIATPYQCVISHNCNEIMITPTREGYGYSVRCIKEKE